MGDWTDNWVQQLTNRIRSHVAKAPDVTLELMTGVTGTWNEWERLLGVLGRLRVGQDSPLYVGYPLYGDARGGSSHVAEVAEMMRLHVQRVLIREGTELDWEVVRGNLRFAGVLYYRFHEWPCLIAPLSMEWLLETYVVTQKTYLYVSNEEIWPAR